MSKTHTHLSWAPHMIGCRGGDSEAVDPDLAPPRPPPLVAPRHHKLLLDSPHAADLLVRARASPPRLALFQRALLVSSNSPFSLLPLRWLIPSLWSSPFQWYCCEPVMLILWYDLLYYLLICSISLLLLFCASALPWDMATIYCSLASQICPIGLSVWNA